jgi:signal transduction histidine kinase
MPMNANLTTMLDDDETIARDVAAIGRLNAVPSLLRVVCEYTGMGFAAVARVTDGTWTACAVQDNIQFGLKAGGRLDVHTTLCKESRLARRPVVIDHASKDPIYHNHHTPLTYKIESYISVPIVLQDGQYFGNLCAIDPNPARVSDSRTITMFSLFAELISHELASEERQRLADSALLDAKQTAELREQFIAVLGHDLRTPLSVATMSAEILIRRNEPELASIGQRLRSSARRMTRLIDDVLDLARVRMGSGIGVFMADITDLDEALRHVVAEIRDTNPERQIRESVEVNRTVHCDRERIQQLLSNLLGNALHHGAPDQPVVVDVTVRGDNLLLSVLNRGEPIASENMTKIFQPYWRARSSRHGAGLGLGLHICSQIVNEHGGSLKVSSSVEAGTRFVAEIPITPAQ